jgi:glycosyltransferase involved in cell wall biosynthesis
MNATEKLPLSLVLIAHNEAANLPRCLDSAAPLASEIVVVVNDCTDDTVAIAQRYGARVIEHPWKGHRDQKNIALGYATQPWVLCLDADEEVSPALAASIREFVRRDDKKFAGAYFARIVFFLGRWIRHGDWYPDWSLRLIRRDQGKWGGSPEHDKMELAGAMAKLSGELYHYSYRDMNHQLLKLPYYSDIFLKRLRDRDARWSALGTIFRAKWRFFRSYFLRLGFLDGYPGFYIASFQFFSTLYRHTRLYEFEHGMQKTKSGGQDERKS